MRSFSTVCFRLLELLYRLTTALAEASQLVEGEHRARFQQLHLKSCQEIEKLTGLPWGHAFEILRSVEGERRRAWGVLFRAEADLGIISSIETPTNGDTSNLETYAQRIVDEIHLLEEELDAELPLEFQGEAGRRLLRLHDCRHELQHLGFLADVTPAGSDPDNRELSA